MRKVIEHGKYYQEKKKIEGIPYVKCPECGLKIYINLDYGIALAQCKCGCTFSFETEDIIYRQLI